SSLASRLCIARGASASSSAPPGKTYAPGMKPELKFRCIMSTSGPSLVSRTSVTVAAGSGVISTAIFSPHQARPGRRQQATLHAGAKFHTRTTTGWETVTQSNITTHMEARLVKWGDFAITEVAALRNTCSGGQNRDLHYLG